MSFAPGAIHGGDYRFAIGMAGSCTLVLQTVLPARWFADARSTVTVSGGTHNHAAPPADFLMRVWQPLVARMGVAQTIELRRHGFYPAGGGEVAASVEPCNALQPIRLFERGARQGVQAEAVIAGVRGEVARRELARATTHIAGLTGNMRTLDSNQGPGNVRLIEVIHTNVTEMFASFGERGVTAEVVADRAAREAQAYLDSGAAVGEHLADQLLLPMALAGGGAFTAVSASSHLLTNASVIEKFLPVEVTVSEVEGGSMVRVEIG